MPPDPREILRQLESGGCIERVPGTERWQTTRRWQGAMARAAAGFLALGAASDDLRIPIVHALLDLIGPDIPDDELIAIVAVMLPIELRSLGLVARESS